jgi:hypothetical protein
MSKVRDIVQLKLQKRILQEQLVINEKNLHRLGDIIHKKSTSNPFSGTADQLVMTMTGKTVNEFRILSKSTKILSTQQLPNDTLRGATPVLDNNILRIRQSQKLKTTGRNEIKELIKLREIEKNKKMKRPKGVPFVSVPESMLPNRYIRGELPCTIEHGKGGRYLSWACPLENLDYEYYLPLFFDGLQCKEYPISFITRQGLLYLYILNT